MSLRTRLLLGYGYLVFLVILVAGSGIVGFFDLGDRIDQILEDNVKSLRETTHLLEALERQDSATLAELVEHEEDAISMAKANDEFTSALEAIDSNVTSDKEREIVSQVRRSFEAYREARTQLLTNRKTATLTAYRNDVFPAFQEVKTNVMALLERNHQAIVNADKRAQQQASQYGSWLGLLVLVSLMSFVLLTRGLRRWFLSRLSEIEAVASDVAAGERQRRVPVERLDELGRVAREFNRSLDRQDEVERRLEGQDRAFKQRMVGMLQVIAEEAWIVGLSGRILASNASDGEWTAGDARRFREAVVEAGGALEEKWEEQSVDAPPETQMELDGATLTVTLLVTPEKRKVGYLVVAT